MSDSGPRRIRRPGDRLVRRRVESQQVMELPPVAPRPAAPTMRTNAQRFAMAYIGLVLVGATLLSTPLTSERREWTSFIDSLFTAISATAVTGLITVDTQDHWNFFGELLILIMIQLGGLGFMVGASLVLLTMRRSSSLRGSLIMSSGAPTISIREARNLSRRILVFTLVTEAIGALLLAIEYISRSDGVPDAAWFGIFHSISAFCNAGFDLRGGGESLADFRGSVLVNVTIMSLIQMGALSFIVFGDLWSKRHLWRPGALWPRRYWSRLTLDTRLILITNYALVLIGAVTFMAVEWDATLSPVDTPIDRVITSLFQSVASRTAGFATIPYADAHASTLFVWIGLMFIGGATASTAGGVKLSTFAVVVLAVLSTARGQTEPQFSGRRIPTPLIFRAMTVMALFLMVHFILTLTLVITEDLLNDQSFGFLALMFETMSALATVGLSTGLTGELSDPGKLVLCVAMFIGRLGPLTAVYALQRRAAPQDYTYPEAYIRIG